MLPQDNIHLAGVADPVSAGTHLAAFVAMLGGLKALVRRAAADGRARALVAVYAASQLVQYASSTLYHVSDHHAGLRRLDHATIYVLIAGTFTAIAGLATRGALRVLVLGAIWSFTVFGVVLKTFFFDAIGEGLDTAFYLGAGWFGTVPTVAIWWRGDRGTTAWLLAGAVTYTAGALCELLRWPLLVPRVFNFHEVFHLCVIAAGGAMYVAVRRTLDGRLSALEAPVVVTRR